MGSNPISKDKIIDEIRRRVIGWEREHWVAYPRRLDRMPYKVLIAELLLKSARAGVTTGGGGIRSVSLTPTCLPATRTSRTRVRGASRCPA